MQQTNVSQLPPVILRSWFPFDDLWDKFWIVYSVQFITMWIGMIIVPSWHCFIVSLKIHAIIRLEVLNHKLQNLHVRTCNISEIFS